MAAKSLTLGVVTTDTLPATAGYAREVQIPKGARWLHLRARSGDLRFASTGTDEASLATYITLSTSQGLVSVRAPTSGRAGGTTAASVSVYVASSSASDVVEMWATEEDA